MEKPKRKSERSGLVTLVVALALLAAGGFAWAMMPETFDQQRVTWSELEYRASKLGFSTTSRISLEAVESARETGDFLTTADGSGLFPEAPEIQKLSIATSLLGRDSTSEVWFDPFRAISYQVVQLTTGKRHRYRAYRFADQYVQSYLRKPENGQQDLPPAGWTDTDEQRWPYPAWSGKELVVTSPSALFYVLSTAELSKVGDTVVIPVFTRTAVNLMRIRVEERARPKAEFEVVTPGSRTTKIRGRRDVLRLSLNAQPLDTATQSDFQFIGLHGDVQICLDEQYRVPLEVRGNVPHAGKVKVKLRKVVLR